MVKGYEFAKDRYVTFTAEELKALDEIATQTIDIAEFVPERGRRSRLLRQRLPPRARTKGGAKAYRLLALALERAGQGGARRATPRAASSTSCSSARAAGGS